MTWCFGAYIEKLRLEKGWSKNRLAKESGLSSGYLTWLINGQSSDKINPPKLGVDTLLSLAEALTIHPMRLILAYKGKDPDQFGTTEMDDELLEEVTKAALDVAMQKFKEKRP